MNLISLLTAFVPWIAFTLVAEAPLGNPLMCLTLAFIVGIVLTLLTSYRQLLQGYILSVVTIVFFVRLLHPDHRIEAVPSRELHFGTLDADPYGCLLGDNAVPVPLHPPVFKGRRGARACEERAIHAGKLYHHRGMGSCFYPRHGGGRLPAAPA